MVSKSLVSNFEHIPASTGRFAHFGRLGSIELAILHVENALVLELLQALLTLFPFKLVFKFFQFFGS